MYLICARCLSLDELHGDAADHNTCASVQAARRDASTVDECAHAASKIFDGDVIAMHDEKRVTSRDGFKRKTQVGFACSTKKMSAIGEIQRTTAVFGPNHDELMTRGGIGNNRQGWTLMIVARGHVKKNVDEAGSRVNLPSSIRTCSTRRKDACWPKFRPAKYGEIMVNVNKDIVIVGAKRTAFGTMNGALEAITANDLAAHAAKAALAQAGVKSNDVGHVVVGNVQQTSADAIYCARHVGLKAGLPIEVPALTVNRLCGSGFEAVVQAAMLVLLGDADVVLCGGTENMSQAPHVLRGGRKGFAFGKAPALEDSLWSALTDSYVQSPMAMTAENLATKYGISRDDCDEYSLRSQKLWAAANEGGAFKDEIVPVELPGKRGAPPVQFVVDEHARPLSTREALAKLAPVFKKDGVVTAGNASGICDGAAMLVVTSAAVAQEKGLQPLARLLGWASAGVDPALMGIGPAAAIPKALAKAGLRQDDIDIFDVNEAFAPQWLAVQKELGLPLEKCNVNGGAIALGHPLGASGARITANLVYTLRRLEKRYGVGSACIGGGQGIAVVLERL